QSTVALHHDVSLIVGYYDRKVRAVHLTSPRKVFQEVEAAVACGREHQLKRVALGLRVAREARVAQVKVDEFKGNVLNRERWFHRLLR
ncbi:hypothetical protein, partial [Kitasatospora nipponensis]|uniref:hypothetical protein n=1 Tax=Kitasatospora nipponensis TaxID=258049 RepID=UPI0031D9FD7A